MINQTIVRIGNSVGVIIPKSLQENDRLKPGDKVSIDKDRINGDFIVSKNGKARQSSITPQFVRILENVNKRYGKALQELAGR